MLCQFCGMKGPTQILLLFLVGWAAAAEVIDVSHLNSDPLCPNCDPRPIDWAMVAMSGVKLAIAKASEGGSYHDPTFQENWRGIKANGIRAGAYHYLRGGDPASTQVENIKSVLHSVNFGADDMLAIDVEEIGNEGVSKEQIADTLKGVLDGLKGEYHNLWIYTGFWYWENEVAWNRHDFSDYKLWIAHYTDKLRPDVPTTWRCKGYSLWQYTSTRSVKGVSGHVDESRFP